MKVEIDGIAYRIRFKHDQEAEHSHGQGITFCSILNPEGDVLGLGMAYCSRYDTYNKEKGRKVALSFALQEWSESDKLKRAKVWAEYFGRFGK